MPQGFTQRVWTTPHRTRYAVPQAYTEGRLSRAKRVVPNGGRAK